MEQKKKVRLSDIAKKLNISTVTVSKALANKEGVGDELRQEIKNLAEEMGYKMKSTSSVNNGNITGNIGILIPTRFFGQNDSFYWYLFNHLSTELLHRNYYSIMELLSDEDEKNNTLPRMIKDNKVDGMIILGQVNTNYISMVKNNYKNFVLLDFYTDDATIDSVSNDDYFCSYTLTNYVISQGHKKIQFVGNFDSTTSIQDRFLGFQKAMYKNNLAEYASLDKIINDRDENSRLIEFNLPSADEMPTAFICNCDLTAAHLINDLTQKGYNVPQDISVTGFDNYLAQNINTVPLTTAYIKPEDTATMTADLIIKKITNQNYIKGRHLVGGSIIIRDSVKKL